MKINFSISELCIEDADIPQHVADKLLKYHIIPMQKVRDKLGRAIYCTTSEGLNSGYRSENWEFSRGRTGDSQHVFKGKGAIDWRCKRFTETKHKLLHLIIKHTDYTRIAVYNSFIHCDYKANNGKRYLYESNSSNRWKLTRKFI